MGPSGLPSGPMAWIVFEHVQLLGAGIEAQAGVAAGVAHGQSEHMRRLLLAVGIAQVAGQVDGVMQRDHRGVAGIVRQEGRSEVEVGDSRVLVRLVERGVAAHLGGGQRVLLAVDGPGNLRRGE